MGSRKRTNFSMAKLASLTLDKDHDASIGRLLASILFLHSVWLHSSEPIFQDPSEKGEEEEEEEYGSNWICSLNNSILVF